MNALIENIQNFCVHDGKGIRTVIFFKGCPLNCLWCSNPTTQNYQCEVLYDKNKCFYCKHCVEVCPTHAITFNENHFTLNRALCNSCGLCVKQCPGKALILSGKTMSLEDILTEIQKDFVFYRNSGGGITLSGGEVLSQAEFAIQFLQACSRYSINLAIETSGYGKKENLLQIGKLVDQIFFDIKHANDEIHKIVTGKSNKLILENLNALLEEQADKVIVRFPLIPEINDSEEHLIQYATLINQLPQVKQLEILPYHRLGKNKYNLLGKEYLLDKILPYEKKELAKKGEFLKEKLHHVHVFWN